MKTAFIGHRQIFAKNIYENLVAAIAAEIKNGCKKFTMGTHGQFDRLALRACRQLRNIYPDIDIEVAITSLNSLKKDIAFDTYPYADVKTFMYDIEEAHFKQRITLSNRKMLDTCDTLICYVDTSMYRSGAKTAFLYAVKRGIKTINLYKEEDNPFYGMTKEEIDLYIKTAFEKLDNK